MGCDSESGETSCEDVNVVKPQEIKGNNIEAKIHACPYKGCNRVFVRPWRLESHICRHTGERPYVCSVPGCEKAYTNPSHLRRHVAASHKTQSENKTHFKCPYPGCLLELSNEQNLKRHYNRKHKRKYPFNCKHCDKGFHKHSQLRSHLYQHTGVPPLKCQECGVGFTLHRELRRHERSHKVYTCDFPNCEQTFANWSQVRTHVLLNHPSEYTCDICNKSFKEKNKLRIHVSVHLDSPERKLFVCPHDDCPRYYYQQRNLRHHIKVKHEGKKFKCTYPECGKELGAKKTLDYHMKLHTAKRPLPHRTNKSRRKRCDAGKPKRSMAVKLSGVSIPYKEEKLLLNNDMTEVRTSENEDEKVKDQLDRNNSLSESSKASLE